jgi:hypothetical protein
MAQGGAAAEILAKADAMRADLLVMGTHGRSGFERLGLGSVTEKVVRKATCAVLSVPRRVPDAVPAVRFKRILCAVTSPTARCMRSTMPPRSRSRHEAR